MVRIDLVDKPIHLINNTADHLFVLQKNGMIDGDTLLNPQGNIWIYSYVGFSFSGGVMVKCSVLFLLNFRIGPRIFD